MSPGFDSKILYGNDVFCNWQIIADDGYVLQLAINTLKIENSNFCLKDYLAVVRKSKLCHRGAVVFTLLICQTVNNTYQFCHKYVTNTYQIKFHIAYL